MLVVSEPFSLQNPFDRDPGRVAASLAIVSNIVFTAVAFLKHKPFAGTVAIALPPVGWVAAARLAKPDSPWARRFYDAAKNDRAGRRAQEGVAARVQRRVVHLVGGD
jgi:lysyl-tRNA synthetase class 2